MAKAGKKNWRKYRKNSKDKKAAEKTKEAKPSEPRPTVDKQIKGVKQNLAARTTWVQDTLGVSWQEAAEMTQSLYAYTATDRYLDIHNNEEFERQNIDDLDKLIKNPKMPILNGEIYRGIHVDDDPNMTAKEKMDAILSTGTWNEPGITSFSTNKRKARQFSGGLGNSKKGLNVLVISKKNKTGVPIQHLSPQRPEGEVLLPSDIKNRGFRITKHKYQTKNGTYEYGANAGKSWTENWLIIEVEEND